MRQGTADLTGAETKGCPLEGDMIHALRFERSLCHLDPWDGTEGPGKQDEQSGARGGWQVWRAG